MSRPLFIQCILAAVLVAGLGFHGWMLRRENGALESRVKALESAAKATPGNVSPEFQQAVEAVVTAREQQAALKRKQETLAHAQTTMKTYLARDLPKISGMDVPLRDKVEALVMAQMVELSDLGEDPPTPEAALLKHDTVNIRYLEEMVGVLGQERREAYISAARGWFGGMLLPRAILVGTGGKPHSK